MEPISNIYQEVFFPRLNRQQALDIFQKNESWRRFLGVTKEDIPTPNIFTQKEGVFHWKRFFFLNTKGVYKVISIKENAYFLADITIKNCNSSILITFEEKDGGILIHLDHRSFRGSDGKFYSRFFTKYWRKTFQAFTSLIES